MTTGQLLFLGASVLTCCLCCACGRAPAEPGQERVVRLAELEIFATYADMPAYEAHIRTPHFTKYKTGTQHIVKSLTLVETDPILLGAKSR